MHIEPRDLRMRSRHSVTELHSHSMRNTFKIDDSTLLYELITNSHGGTKAVDNFVLGVEWNPGLFHTIFVFSGSSQDSSQHFLPFSECYLSCFIFPPQVLNGYFVHYFAPKNLPPLPKNVVFVLDISASMVGAKLQQVSQLPAHDFA